MNESPRRQDKDAEDALTIYTNKEVSWVRGVGEKVPADGTWSIDQHGPERKPGGRMLLNAARTKWSREPAAVVLGRRNERLRRLAAVVGAQHAQDPEATRAAAAAGETLAAADTDQRQYTETVAAKNRAARAPAYTAGAWDSGPGREAAKRAADANTATDPIQHAIAMGFRAGRRKTGRKRNCRKSRKSNRKRNCRKSRKTNRKRNCRRSKRC